MPTELMILAFVVAVLKFYTQDNRLTEKVSRSLGDRLFAKFAKSNTSESLTQVLSLLC